ncbi:MAG TPA: tRNA (cytidine(34)-2'-O)-methyltransferase [Candidatus Avipropionibacterium avicola]|uniref:Putative tRNA (cytidine(34)-2'-O)-methyltransferase n=1 Tax=Candidatus Avipropionibacterium avicola TaxID=2840701 RepID=A0A9D1GXJ4_9ACTN|nr:tRNA (cytidine(34)-2'-O)-methyltransferase [Candidatus Avipropionibacterium avicola]
MRFNAQVPNPAEPTPDEPSPTEPAPTEPWLHLGFVEPRIPQNTGSAIRLSAVTGAMLHLVEPLGFSLDEARVRRAGLDYHDMALVRVHPDLDDLLASVSGSVYAFTAHARHRHTDIVHQPGDLLLFGPEPTGLSEQVLGHPRVSEQIRIPMVAGRRSLNLANSASIACYEAARQLGFPGFS